MAMARRLGSLTLRRTGDLEDVLDRSEPTSPREKSRSYPHLTFCLMVTVLVFLLLLTFGQTGFHYLHFEEPKQARKADFVVRDVVNARAVNVDDGEDNFSALLASKDGDLSSRPECRAKICDALPMLQEVYGRILHRTLHIGPGTCGVVSDLLKEDDVEVWGIQPFDMREPIHPLCDNFVRKGIVRISDPYEPLPYRKNSFSLVLVTGTLDHMRPKELNQSLSDLASVSSHSLVLVVGNGVKQRVSRRMDLAKLHKPPKPRYKAWWQRRFEMVGLKEDEERTKRFENLQSERSYKTSSIIFHLHVPQSF